MKSTKYYCDRCGAEIKKDVHNVIRILDFGQSENYISKDLCPSCTRGLWNYMAKKVISYSDICREDF